MHSNFLISASTYPRLTFFMDSGQSHIFQNIKPSYLVKTTFISASFCYCMSGGRSFVGKNIIVLAADPIHSKDYFYFPVPNLILATHKGQIQFQFHCPNIFPLILNQVCPRDYRRNKTFHTFQFETQNRIVLNSKILKNIQRTILA